MTTTSNPYESPPSPAAPPVLPRSAQSRLVPVAIGLLVVSLLQVYSTLYFFGYVYMVAGAPDADPRETHPLITYSMFHGVAMLYSLMLASGAFSMIRLGSYTWAMTVCILALVPFLGPCIFLAVPLGIWGIVVLRRPDVRAAFSRP